MTPEGRVKAAVNKVLAAYGDYLYRYMPVPAGYGPSSLDYIICIRGLFVSIETKKPGGKLTARQQFTMRQMEAAGGKVFVIEDGTGVGELIKFLNWVLEKPRTHEEVKAWPGYPKSR